MRINLQLADWPELSLGPAVVSEESYPQVVGRLLAGESVLEAAGESWARERTSARYGRVLLRLETFDARSGLAHLTCEAKLAGGEVPLMWRERLEFRNSKWGRSVGSPTEPANWIPENDNLEIALNQALLPAVGGLEDFVEEFFIKTTNQHIQVSVERDAFGDGRWLKLNPLGVKIRCGIPVPFLRIADRVLRVYAGGIAVDLQEISLPDEYRVEYLRTFPFPKFALSDPEVRINLARQELGIACKMTPPILGNLRIRPGIVQGDWDGQDLLRLDNPWLHVFYLRTEISGSLAASELGVDLNVVALRKHEIARGKASINFGKQQFLGQLRGQSPGETHLPELEGELRINRDGFKTNMYLAALAQGVHGELIIPFPKDGSTRLPAFWARTHMQLPVVRSVTLEGEIEPTWDRGELSARGFLDASRYPWGGAVQWEVKVVFAANSQPKISYVYRWYSQDGHRHDQHFHYDSLEEVSESAMEAELMAQVEETGEPVQPPGPEERDTKHRPGDPPVGIDNFDSEWQGDSLRLFRVPREENSDLAVIGSKEWKGFGITDLNARDQVESLSIAVIEDSQLKIWLAVNNRNLGRVWLSPRGKNLGPEGAPQELRIPESEAPTGSARQTSSHDRFRCGPSRPGEDPGAGASVARGGV